MVLTHELQFISYLIGQDPDQDPEKFSDGRVVDMIAEHLGNLRNGMTVTESIKDVADSYEIPVFKPTKYNPDYVKQRVDQLSDMGLMFTLSSSAYIKDDFNVPILDVRTLSAEARESMINKIKLEIDRRKMYHQSDIMLRVFYIMFNIMQDFNCDDGEFITESVQVRFNTGGGERLYKTVLEIAHTMDDSFKDEEDKILVAYEDTKRFLSD